MENLATITKEANKIVQSLLINSSVESFGLLHQMYFMEFRNSFGEDIHLSIDSEIVLLPNLNIDNITENEYKLLCFNKLNLLKVTDINCTASSDLEIYFDSYLLKIIGVPSDKSISEPWQISNKKEIGNGHGILVIALAGNGYAIWK
jgi:hypothetical protein